MGYSILIFALLIFSYIETNNTKKSFIHLSPPLKLYPQVGSPLLIENRSLKKNKKYQCLSNNKCQQNYYYISQKSKKKSPLETLKEKTKTQMMNSPVFAK